ncbi:MAG: hypothetical protein IKE38_04675 [Erysipelotrichaceae bacterium]|nr:hypothetical protein [Erysipelotrichaceae bacterium]
MDKKTFKKKLIRNRISKGCFIVLVLLTAVFLILGFFRMQSGKSDMKSLAVYREDVDTYAYLYVSRMVLKKLSLWIAFYSDYPDRSTITVVEAVAPELDRAVMVMVPGLV